MGVLLPSFVSLRRYLVAADELQANFTGSQQRQGVYILPHAVAKVFALGAPKPANGSTDATEASDGREVTAHGNANDGTAAAVAPTQTKGVPSQTSGKHLVAAVGDGTDASPFKFEEGHDADNDLPTGFQLNWGA